MINTEDVIQVVLAVYDPSGKYSRHAGVVMTSIFEHTKSRVRVTILHDATLTEDNRTRFQKTTDTWNQDVQFIDVSEHILKIADSMDEIDVFAKNFSRGMFFRLLVPDIMEVRKVVYLDCDIAVNLDIKELWNVDIEEFSLAAVPDETNINWNSKIHGKVRAWAMQYDGQKYFYSGVLLMNLERIRQKKRILVKEAKKFFKRYRFCLDFPDQDFFNVFFRDDVRYIEERFNRVLDRCHIDNAIMHFTKDYRPWTVHLCEPRDYFYWETFARSAWCDQLVDAMLETYKNNPYTHHHTSNCYKRILARWKKDILLNNGLVKLVKDVMIYLKELKYRLFDD